MGMLQTTLERWEVDGVPPHLNPRWHATITEKPVKSYLVSVDRYAHSHFDNANFDQSQHGVFIDSAGMDFFVNLLNMNTAWKATLEAEDLFEGCDHITGELRWVTTREVYAGDDAQQVFVHDFVAAWAKVASTLPDLVAVS